MDYFKFMNKIFYIGSQRSYSNFGITCVFFYKKTYLILVVFTPYFTFENVLTNLYTVTEQR